MGLGASKRRAFEFKDGCGCRINTPLDSRIMAVLKETRSAQKAPESFEKILLQLPKIRATFGELKNIFEQYDADSTGSIDLAEIKNAVAELAGAGTGFSEEDVVEIYDCADEDGQDGLDFREFLAFICIGFLLEVIPQARGTGADNAAHALRLCADAFFLLDRNNDGIIVKAELDAQDVSDVFSSERFKELDRDNSGFVSFAEFLHGFLRWVEDSADEDAAEGAAAEGDAAE